MRPVAASLGFFEGLAVLAQAWCLASLLDAVIIGQAHLTEITPWFIGLGLAWVARAFATALKGLMGARASSVLRTKLRSELFTTALASGPLLRKKHSTGGLAQSIIERVDALDAYYAKYQPQLITVLILPLMLVLAIASTNWLAGLVLVLSAPFIPLFMALIGMGASKLSLEQQHALDRLGGLFYDRISGLATLTRFHAAGREQDKLKAYNESFRHRTMRVLRVAFLSSAVLEFFSALAIAVMAIYIGFSLLGFIRIGPSDEMTLRTGLFMLLLAPEFYNPLRTLGQFWHDRATALASASSLILLQKEPPARAEPASPEGALVNNPPRGLSISLDQVSLKVGLDRVLIKNATIELEAGLCHLIEGPSGSGKTTLLNHLAGFIAPTQGTIAFDDIDLRSLTRQELHQLRAWLGQRAQLVSGTVRENLCLSGAVDDDQVLHKVLVQAGLGGWLEQYPDGLDLKLGPEGLGLSRGQIQRLCLARVLIKPKPLLLLDEPTTGLDEHTELKLWSDLKELSTKTGVTIVATSHSPLARTWGDARWVLANQKIERT